MTHTIDGSSRREFLTASTTIGIGLGAVSGAAAALGLAPRVSFGQARTGTDGAASAGGAVGATPPPGLAYLPRQDPALAREMVGVSHRDVDRVRALLEQSPALCNAAIDWGFGDWETALGAASHTGRRPIAEALLAAGARPDHFTFAMMGNLDALRAAIEAQPGLPGTPGPHSITLLSHAKAGGEAASEVVAYLEARGDADPKPALVALSDDEKAAVLGVYRFGPGEIDWFEVTSDDRGLWISRAGDTKRGIRHLGEFAFYPVGAAAVRVRFAVESGRAETVTVFDPGPIVVAVRE